MPRIPERLGELRLVRQLGLGRQCQVWEAVDETSRRRVAVKVLVPEVAKDAQQLRLLRQELTVAKGIDHPNLVRIESFSRVGLPHLVMELFPHPNLKRQLNAGLETLAPRLDKIVLGLASGLEHLHARGWVHRDVKPENILADADGNAKLLDYAIAARKAGLLGRLFGGRGTAQGSPSYISPEQLRGRAVDPRSDLYSFGCVLFELIAGRPPYTAANYNELLNKHISAPLPAVEAVNPKASKAASKLIKQLLAKKPADRPASMTEVIRQLRGMTLLQ